VDPIRTARLELIPATPDSLRAALAGPEALATALGAAVPASWPPEFLDAAALEYTLERLERGTGQAGWWMYYVVLHDAGERTLIGSAGYKGPPDGGTVEIGYGIVADRRRRGFAVEAAQALIARAFDRSDVTRVIAETLPELVGSIAVLRRCGFELEGEGSEPGVIRFTRARATG
jgi:RimJ/RimL family protein N-acetyltransferase